MLDNCEHLIDACAQLTVSLLQACPTLRVLATSREELRLPGETTWLVPTLPYPNIDPVPPVDALRQHDAVRLFLDRARATSPTIELTEQNASAIAHICHRLDGIPLALELAAARTSALSVEQIAGRLDDRFQLLTKGYRSALPRHRTLHTAIEWSYGLLPEPERTLFRRLSVFAGGWTLEAAEAVCGDDSGADVLDLLTQLVKKSLVLGEARRGEMRYRMLETIRQYAWRKLVDSDEGQHVRDGHLMFLMRFAEEAESKIQGPEQMLCLSRLETELDNLRAAIEWSLKGADCTPGLRLASALGYFWFIHSHHVEAQSRLRELLARQDAGTPAALRAKALLAVAKLLPVIDSSTSLGNDSSQPAVPIIEEALAIGRELDDPLIIARSLKQMGEIMIWGGDFAPAITLLDESISLLRASDAPWYLQSALHVRGLVAQRLGDRKTAHASFGAAAAIARSLGDKGQLAPPLRGLARLELDSGHSELAAGLFTESLTINVDIGDTRGALASMVGLISVLTLQGDFLRAAQLAAAIEAQLESDDTHLIPGDSEPFARAVQTLRAELGASPFDRAWAAGRKLTLEQAIAAARQACTPPATASAAASASPTVPPAGLTAREAEVLRLLARGLTDAQIAESLVISPRTVNAHLRSIYSKLDVTTRTAAARYAAQFKLE